MLEFTTPKTSAPVEREREPLFTLDGTEYTIPVQMTVPEMYSYVHMRRTLGNDAAVSWAMEQALGEQGYFALLTAKDSVVSDTAFIQLANVITARYLGLSATVPGPKAEAPSAEPESASAAEDREPSDEEVWGTPTAPFDR